MLMGIQLNIIYYTVIFILDSVCQFHIQIMWYTHICYPIDILSAFEFIYKDRHQTCSLQNYFFNPLDNWMTYITQLNDYWPDL